MYTWVDLGVSCAVKGTQCSFALHAANTVRLDLYPYSERVDSVSVFRATECDFSIKGKRQWKAFG